MITDIVDKLLARLPELEWKIGSLSFVLRAAMLPRGLFKQRSDITAHSCVEEIKSDLVILKTQTNERVAQHIANQVGKKIDVLVRICQLQRSTTVKQHPVNFTINKISTREQWLTMLYTEAATLQLQRDAIATTCAMLQKYQQTTELLKAQTELAELESRLAVVNTALETVKA